MRNLTRTLSNSVTSTKLRKDNILRPYVVSVKNKVQEKIQFLFEMHKVQFASVTSETAFQRLAIRIKEKSLKPDILGMPLLVVVLAAVGGSDWSRSRKPD